MNQYDFSGKVAVVTGGAQGIGLSVVQRLLAGGAAVALWDRDPVALDAARQALEGQGRVHTVVTDITDMASVGQGCDRQRLDGPVCAGRGPGGQLCDHCLGSAQAVLRAHQGVMHRRALPAVAPRDRGH